MDKTGESKEELTRMVNEVYQRFNPYIEGL